MLEQMAYKMEPSGHEERAPRREYSKPDMKLAKAFEDWLRIRVEWSWGLAYATAESMVRDVKDFSSEDVNALAIAYQDHPKFHEAGLFFSAMYNHGKDKEMVFNPGKELSMEFLGYHLRPEKILVNLVPVCSLGDDNIGGILLNYEKLTTRLGGGGHHGLAVNYGTAQSFDGDCRNTVHINFGTISLARVPSNVNSLFINFGTWGMRKHVDLEYQLNERNYIPLLPALDKYAQDLQQLFEPGKTDYKKAIEAARSLGPKPAQKVLNDIGGLLKEAGFNV